MPRILYIAYWGALEQLGQSLVIPAVREISRMGFDLTLVTFEKPSDLEKKAEMERVREMLKEDGIEWIPLKYHKEPKIPATLFDVAYGIAHGLQRRLKKKFDIVHGRTFVGGLIGLTLASLLRAEFIYHNEGFYPDEQVDGGVWTENSRPHRIAKRLENFMYARSSGIIALSHRAKSVIENYPEVKKKQTPVIVVPSCVDLERFSLSARKLNDGADEGVNLVYIGSVGGRYILDKVSGFVAAAVENEKPPENVRLQIYSKADTELVNEMMAAGGLSENLWNQKAISYFDMPVKLAEHQAGLFFLTQGISEHGCSPTKIGEYWAVGLPVITTPNVSDIDDIIKKERVGVIVSEHSKEAYSKAFDELRELLKDPYLKSRCRKAAENYYSLKSACERQSSLYRSIVEKS